MSARTPLDVASVLLVAIEARQRDLAPWLRVMGEPVRYRLERVAPGAEPSGGPWNVIVVDGDSIPTVDAREEVLATMSREPFAVVLYIASRLPSDIEVDRALAWATDLILQDADLGDRLRRRVQAVALAPWRASSALRWEAQRLGDRRLRVVSPAAGGREAHGTEASEAERSTRLSVARSGQAGTLAPVLPPALARQAWAIGGPASDLVRRAFDAGRSAGVASALKTIDSFCALSIDDLRAAARLTPKGFAERFAAGAAAVSSIRDRLEQIALEELSRPYLAPEDQGAEYP